VGLKNKILIRGYREGKMVMGVSTKKGEGVQSHNGADNKQKSEVTDTEKMTTFWGNLHSKCYRWGGGKGCYHEAFGGQKSG